MGALLRLSARLLLAPFVALLIGIVGGLAFVLGRKPEEELSEPEPVEVRERVEEDENERGERRWSIDLRHHEYKALINRVWAKNCLDTAARIQQTR